MPSALTRLVESYLDHLVVERGVSGHTAAAYRRDLRRYVDYLSERGITEPGRVTTALISDYAMRLREGVPDSAEEGWAERPLSAASVARAVVAVRSLHKFAVAEGVVSDDPAAAVAPPRPPRRLPKALSLEQVQAMLDVPATDTELGLRDAALLELLYGTGLRISEAVGLDVDDVSAPCSGPGRRSGAPGFECSARGARSGSCRSARTPGRRSRRTWSGPAPRWPGGAPATRRCS